MSLPSKSVYERRRSGELSHLTEEDLKQLAALERAALSYEKNELDHWEAQALNPQVGGLRRNGGTVEPLEGPWTTDSFFRSSPYDCVDGELQPADMAFGKPTLIVFPGSWNAKTGSATEPRLHRKGHYDEVVYTYEDIFKQYTQANIQIFESILPGCGDGCQLPIVTAVYDRLPEKEQRQIKHALNLDPNFCHPHMMGFVERVLLPRIAQVEFEDGRVKRDTGKLLAKPYAEEEIIKNFRGLVFGGYSYGCLAATQCLTYLKSLMEELQISRETIDSVMKNLLTIKIGHNSNIHNIPAESPSITIVSGRDELAMEGADVESFMWRSAVCGEKSPIKAGNQSFVYPITDLPHNIKLVDGKIVPPFFATRHGHDRDGYVSSIRKFPEIGEAIARYANQGQGELLVLEDILKENSKIEVEIPRTHPVLL